jgi:hypothetical protein
MTWHGAGPLYSDAHRRACGHVLGADETAGPCRICLATRGGPGAPRVGVRHPLGVGLMVGEPAEAAIFHDGSVDW